MKNATVMDRRYIKITARPALREWMASKAYRLPP
jgi:hypothetical protein